MLTSCFYVCCVFAMSKIRYNLGDTPNTESITYDYCYIA